ncbi:MAG: hypothetical protein KC435_09310 [Thermomicrobiales bacterium]|nr:hypothetical protein [Thermomicrobiales bacterium]
MSHGLIDDGFERRARTFSQGSFDTGQDGGVQCFPMPRLDLDAEAAADSEGDVADQGGDDRRDVLQSGPAHRSS